MATWYVTQDGAGAANGTSLANAWSAAQFSNATQWGAGEIEAGSIVYLSGVFTSRLTIQGSGTNASSRIVLVGLPSAPPTIVGINGAGFDYVAVIACTFTQTSTSNNYAEIAWNGAVGWLVYGNVFDTSYRDAITGSTSGNNSNIIRRNTFIDIGGIDGGAAAGASGTSLVNINGNSNLIEYNSSSLSMDRMRVFGTGNVVRNNYWGYTDTTFYPDSDPYPFHTDGLQSFEGTLPLVQILYDRNYDTDNRDTIGGATNAPNGHGFLVQDGGSNNFNWFVIRQNIMIREAESAMLFRNISNIQAYNNTIVNMGFDKTSQFNNAVLFESPGNDIVDFRNNTFPFNQNMRDSNGIIYNANRTNFTSAANHSYNPSGQQVVLPTGASPANLAQTDPLFTDGNGTAGNDDYTLTASSPLRDAAAYITEANGAGTDSTELVVDNAKRLFDGWGIADADFITIGAGAEVQIDSIDYDTNTVTLTAARTWSDNDDVYVRGTTDVGALPYGAATAPAIVSGVVTDATGTASVTVSDAFNVRFVELLVDGIPVATQYTPTGNVYAMTWSGDGNPSHNFTAVAYAAWASATPTVELQIYVSQAATQVRTVRSPASIGLGF